MKQERERLVQTVEVCSGGVVHRASYFIENNIIHARIGDHSISTPLGNVPAGDTVKALLTEHLVQRRRLTHQAERWLSAQWLNNAAPHNGA